VKLKPLPEVSVKSGSTAPALSACPSESIVPSHEKIEAALLLRDLGMERYIRRPLLLPATARSDDVIHATAMNKYDASDRGGQY